MQMALQKKPNASNRNGTMLAGSRTPHKALRARQTKHCDDGDDGDDGGSTMATPKTLFLVLTPCANMKIINVAKCIKQADSAHGVKKPCARRHSPARML